MTKTQYYTATSADGFIADEANSLDWLFEVDRSGPDRFAKFSATVGAMCMGATTYEWVLGHDRLLEQPEKCALRPGVMCMRSAITPKRRRPEADDWWSSGPT